VAQLNRNMGISDGDGGRNLEMKIYSTGRDSIASGPFWRKNLTEETTKVGRNVWKTVKKGGPPVSALNILQE